MNEYFETLPYLLIGLGGVGFFMSATGFLCSTMEARWALISYGIVMIAVSIGMLGKLFLFKYKKIKNKTLNLSIKSFANVGDYGGISGF